MHFLILLIGIATLLPNNVELFHLNHPAQSPLYYGRLSEIYPDEGEPVSIKFITRLRHRRDVSTKEYHIMRLNIPSRDETFDIHLTRNADIDQLTEPEGQEQEPSQGLFTGTIFKSKSTRGSTVNMNEASVAVSLSTNEDGAVEVNGHLITEQGHFVIEPATATTTNAEEPKGIGETIHRIYNVQKLIKKENVTQSDVLRVPKEELEKAYKEMENSTDSSDGSDSPDSADHDDNTDIATTGETESETDALTSINLDLGDDSDQKDSLSLETFASNGKSKLKTTKTAKNPKKVKPKGFGTAKKSGISEKVVEIAAFADTKLYKLWAKRYPKDPKGRLKGFILNMINNMNLLYKHDSLGMTVSFRLVHLEIQTTKPKSVNDHSGDASKYLRSFCQYAGDKNVRGKKWDHALLLTGFDIREGRDTLVAGLAWFSTMCLRYWSCSISEGYGFSSTFVLTHELGHSLGMEHDGEGVSSSCSQDKYIMSPTTGAGKVTWSSCSSKNIKDFVRTGSSEMKKDKKAIPRCLTRASPLKKQRIKFARGEGKLPGQMFTTKAQCQLECGSNCSPIKDNHKQSLCSQLWCEKPVEQDGEKLMRGTGIHPALEGTPCGSGKYCRFGKCVKAKSR